MKKVIVLAFVLTMFALSANAQSYKQGGKDLNIGIGLGSSLYGDMVIPPISASLDYGFRPNISLGGYLGFATTTYGYYGYEWNYTHIVLGARGAYHFYNEDAIDAYGGLMIGYNIVSVSEPSGWGGTGYESATSGITYSLFLGARYSFTPKFGAFAELGYGVSYLTLGVTLKL